MKLQRQQLQTSRLQGRDRKLQICGRNLSKVVERHLRNASDLPQPLEVDVVYNTGEKETAAILLPHEYFAAMYASPDWWRRSILADESCLYRFWNAFKHHPCMDGHPVKSKKRWEAKAIPLMFYEDEVPVVGVGKVWSRCVLMFEWFSILAQAAGAATEDVMPYICGVFGKMLLATQWKLSGVSCYGHLRR